MSFITFKSNQRLGPAQVFQELQNTAPLVGDAIRKSWYALGHDLKSRANAEILRKPKSGRTYIIRSRSSGRLRKHRASAPGETHANMHGDLRRALAWNVHGNNEMTFGYGLANRESPKYDEFVEFGTRRMSARPSLLNAINFTQGNTQSHFSAEMRKRFGT